MLLSAALMCDLQAAMAAVCRQLPIVEQLLHAHHDHARESHLLGGSQFTMLAMSLLWGMSPTIYEETCLTAGTCLSIEDILSSMP